MTDFNVQHISAISVPVNGTTVNINAVDLSSSICLVNNNRQGTAGAIGLSANNLVARDMGANLNLSNSTTLNVSRNAASNNLNYRVDTSIWEYTGDAGGPNEFIVRSRNSITVPSGTQTITTTLNNTPDNINRCVCFITGTVANINSSNASGISANAYLSGTNTLNIDRANINAGSVNIEVTTIEFVGSNWIIHHGFIQSALSTNNINLTNAVYGTGTGSSVTNREKAFIYSQFRQDGNSANGDIADLSAIYETNTLGSVSYTFHPNHNSAGGNKHLVYVIENNEINVSRYSSNNSSVGSVTIDITSAGITDISRALIFGSSYSSGTGTGHPRGSRNFGITSTTQAFHRCTRSGNTMETRIQIVELPVGELSTSPRSIYSGVTWDSVSPSVI